MMKGQLVEIPANSALYHSPKQGQITSLEELRGHSPYHKYSLFDGFLVGGHAGTASFQLAQRKRIGVGGKNAPLYVIGIDEVENRVFVGEGEDHPGLFSKVFCFKPSHFHVIQNKPFSYSLPEAAVSVKILFSEGTKSEAKLYRYKDEVFLEFPEPVHIRLSLSEICVYKDDTLIANLY